MSLKVVDHYFIFDGKNSLDFSAKISGNQTFLTARRDYEEVQIPGRNGTVTLDNGRFENVTLTYSGYIVENFEKNASSFANYLLKDIEVHRLEDSIHPEEFRLAKYGGPFSPDVIFLEAGSFEINFDAMPQRFLKTGEIPVTITGGTTVTLQNPTYQTALPKLIVTAGTGEISIGDEILTLTANNGATVIDCDIHDAYEGDTNRNADLELTSGGWPTLPPGRTQVSIDAGMTMQIIPRWWKL